MQQPTNVDDLIFTRHAEWRMQQRDITRDEVYKAIGYGEQIQHGPSTLHYDLETWIGVVVDWPTRTVVTVMRLCWVPDWQQVQDKERA